MKNKLFILISLLIATGNIYSQEEKIAHSASVYTVVGYTGLRFPSVYVTDYVNAGVGANYTLWFNSYVGLSFGVQYTPYSGGYKFNNEVMTRTYDDAVIDADGNTINENSIFSQNNRQTEKYTLGYFDFQLRLSTKAPISKSWSIVSDLGVAYGLPVYEESQIISGDYIRSLNYPSLGVVLDKIPSLGLGTYTDFYKKTDSKAFSPQATISLEVGGLWQATDAFGISISAIGAVGITNVKKLYQPFVAFDGYSGILATDQINEVKTAYLGLKLGLHLTFKKKQKNN